MYMCVHMVMASWELYIKNYFYSITCNYGSRAATLRLER